MLGYVANPDVLQMYSKKYGLFLDVHVHVFLPKLSLLLSCRTI